MNVSPFHRTFACVCVRVCARANVYVLKPLENGRAEQQTWRFAANSYERIEFYPIQMGVNDISNELPLNSQLKIFIVFFFSFSWPAFAQRMM